MELSIPLVDILKLNHCHAATSVPPSARARAGKINPPKLEGKVKKCQGVRISEIFTFIMTHIWFYAISKKKQEIARCIVVNVVPRHSQKMDLELELNATNVSNVDSSLRGKLLMEDQ